ncbi:MAG: MiaB/RimO family radical SAM methylthiotransferase [Verrucomicrobia bacterium]|nr:MiaB/RimO family radical SAM methylthiotransferase [Verrucomicrobiota bacterium]
MQYHLLILGCQMNRSDSERVRTVIEGMGYRWTDDETEADLLGVVACSVRQKAIDKVYSRIGRWNLWKGDRNLLTFVSGCMLPADRKKFLKRFDFVFTMNELAEFPDMLRQYGVVTPVALGGADVAAQPVENQHALARSGRIRGAGAGAGLISVASLTRPVRGANRPVMTGLWQVPATPVSEFEAFVPIQNGCDKFCTFCAVPYTRGREVSRPSAEILREVESLVEKGFKSITLLGQNVNSYGHDRPAEELSFAALLNEIGALGVRSGREFWLYFTSPHPRDMTMDVLEAMARHRCIAKQVHLPLQSGDDKVLLRMNRQHSVGQYRAIVEQIRTRLPTATLFTDIIVGFSGETEVQFANTLRVVAETGFDMIYAAMYSPRPGAASSRWKDDIPSDEKKRRLYALNALLRKHVLQANEGQIGRTLPVLVTGRDPKLNCLIGLTEGKINIRLTADEPTWIGRIIDVTVTSAAGLSLTAEPVCVVVG